MEVGAVVHAWGRILTGHRPTLSVEITRECPLRCPGCYAYGDEHLGGGVVLRQLSDLKGQALVDAMKGLSLESPRGPVSIDPQTREMTQNIYVRKVEKVGDQIYNVEFATVPNVKDPVKAAKK